MLGNFEVTVSGGVCRKRGREKLAGSTLTLDRRVAKRSRALGISLLPDAVRNAHRTTRRKLLGIEFKKGGAANPAPTRISCMLDEKSSANQCVERAVCR